MQIPMPPHVCRLLPVLTVMLITGCGGDYDGSSRSDTPAGLNPETPVDNGTDNGSGNGGGEVDPEKILRTFFKNRIDPHLGFCATCHAAGGIADTDAGRDFLLAAGNHYEDMLNSWETLGKGVANNPLLTYNADAAVAHTGGKPWPAGGTIYNDVRTLLLCWDQPQQCTLTPHTTPDTPPPDVGGGETPVPANDLLGSSRGNHVWNRFCETADDEAELPVDPRRMITPGVNEGRAVYFNAWYEDCHINLPEKDQAPKTCGEYKARVARGDQFANERAAMTDLSIPATSFNNLWKAWRMKERPANFDALLTERYGFNPAPDRNPYPLPGEDPVATNGGSGQLPMGFIQGRDAEGHYNGRISMNCYICHGGQIGTAADGPGLGSIPGMGNTNTDLMIFMRDLSRGLVGGLLPVSLNSTRGTSNAVGAFDMLTLIWDVDTLSLAPNPLKLPFSHSWHGNQDMPNWWNSSHRPRKFFDGGVSSDATRIDMAAADQLNLAQTGASRRELTEQHDQDLQAYVDAQMAPGFPAEINRTLAEAGAVIFHSKNLWASGANAAIPAPQGNGSCAGCHGAYAKRYISDPRYLQDPVMEGLAGYIVPLDIINTDRARANSISPTLRRAFGSTWWGYPDGQPGYKPPEEKAPLEEFLDDIDNPTLNPGNRPVVGACGWQEDPGYLAPPLFGVWASSPYFHNGSVPTLRQVLRSSERPAIWKRLDSPVEGRIKGYDMSLAAYDLEAQVGWKYEEYCSTKDTPLEECSADHRVRNNLLLQWVDRLKDNFWLLGFITKPYGTQQQIDARKIYNTHDFSNSNTGHEFTDVLTEAETTAVIEYLKTL